LINKEEAGSSAKSTLERLMDSKGEASDHKKGGLRVVLEKET